MTFLTGYNGFSNVTNSKNKFYFKNSITDEDGFVQITILPSAYEIEALDKELQRIIIGEDHFTKANPPFKIKPIFSTIGSIIVVSSQGPIISLMFDDSIRDLLRFKARTLYEKYISSTNPVDLISFNNRFIETDIVKRMIFKGKRNGIIMKYDVGFARI